MPFENAAGLGVHNFYGRRSTGGAVGVDHSQNAVHRLTVHLTGESVNSTFVPPAVMPKGARVLRYFLDVDEAFSLGGTSPTVIVGGTAPATDGVVLSKTELEAVGSKVPSSTGTGTWSTSSSTGTTAAERVKETLGGTTPTVSPTQGKATLVIEYINVNKV
jgi:hypothetical protein